MVFNKSSVAVALSWVGWVALVTAGGLARADDVLPQAPPASKYAKMAGHSPFAPPTAPVAAPVATAPPPVPGWADSLTAKTIMQDDANNYTVTVVDAQNSEKHLYLTTKPRPDEPMAVASVKWGATRDDPPVITLRKGKEFAQVRYEVGTASLGGANPVGGPPIPGAGRNPIPGVPGAQPFHAPLQANSVQTANQGLSSSTIRRPLIRSQPAPAPVRAGANLPVNGARPNPLAVPDDDDDD